MGLGEFFEKKRAQATYWALTEQHPLRYLFMEVTRKCNLACRYCGSNCTPKGQGEEMPIEKWIELLRHVADNFDAKKVMLAIMGGEPLIKEGIYDLFAEAQKLGFPYGIVSNGCFIDEEAAKKLVSLGIGSISLSMDSIPEYNDMFRGKGSAEKTARAVNNLHAAGYKGILEILSSLTNVTADHLDEMRTFVAELRVPRWRLVPVFAIGRAKDHDYLVSTEQLKNILAYVAKGRKDGKLPVPEFGEESYLGCFNDDVRPAKFTCNAGLTVAGVMFDGKVGACPELGPDFIQGDLKEDTFTNIWNKRYQIFRDRSWTKKLGPCAKCKSFKYCHGGSLHLYPDTKTPISRCFYEMIGGEKGCKELHKAN